MRIFRAELRKLFTSPIFIFVAAAAVVLNIYLCLSAKPVNISDEEYKAFYANLEGLSEQEKTEYIDNSLKALYSSEITYENVMKREFFRNEAEQASLVRDYKEYLNNIDESAKTMTSVSIFADKNSFTYRNISITPAAYDSVRDVKPKYSPSQGVLMAINNNSTDIMLIFIVLTAVTVLFIKEREASVIGLLKPLKYGRQRLAAVKTLAVLAVCLSFGLIICGSSLVIGSMRFGLGDLSRPIQSVEGFLGCNLPVSVWQAILLMFLFKIAAVFLAGLIFECLCTALFSGFAYLSAGIIAAAEIFLYATIESTSWASSFGKINLAAFVQSGEIFKTYLNINIFGYPCNIITVTVISLIVGISLSFAGEMLLFSRISVKDYKSVQIIPSIRYIPKKPFAYGLYKAFVTHRGFLIILIIAAIQIYSASNYTISYNADDLWYRSYCDTLSTMTEEQAEQYIEEEKSRFNELYNSMSKTNSSMALQKIYDELQAEQGFIKAAEQQQYIKSLDSSNKAMFYQTGWRRLFGAEDFTEDMTLALLAALGISFAVSPLISYDNRRRLGFLLYTNKYGRKKYFGQNLALSTIISILISAVVNIPHFIGILSLYKTEGASYSIKCISEFEGFFDIPITAYLLFLFLLRTIFLALCGIIILYISSRCKSTYTALLICLAIFALPIMLYLAGAQFVLPLCMPFSVNREIIEMAWIYPSVLIAVSGCAMLKIKA